MVSSSGTCYHENEGNKFLSSIVIYLPYYMVLYGPGSSVGIVTDYGLNGPGIESQWGEIFRRSRTALGPTQPPVQGLPGFSRG